MNKDNLLFATIGMLCGFILGYVLHEVMAARQPLRRLPGEGAVTAAAAAPDDAGAGGAPGPGGQAAPGAGPGQDSAAAAAPGGTPPPAPPAMAAVQQLRDYVSTHPKDADAVLKLANLNFDINNWSRAKELYAQYLGLREPNPDVLTDLGTCYIQLREFDHALEQFRRAEKLAPDHWKSRFAEVVVLAFDLNQPAAADEAFARLQAVAPAQPEITQQVAQLGAEIQRRRAAGNAGNTGNTGK